MLTDKLGTKCTQRQHFYKVTSLPYTGIGTLEKSVKILPSKRADLLVYDVYSVGFTCNRFAGFLITFFLTSKDKQIGTQTGFRLK